MNINKSIYIYIHIYIIVYIYINKYIYIYICIILDCIGVKIDSFDFEYTTLMSQI